MVEIILTKEQVLNAMKVFPEAKEAFKRVAPQAFEDEWEDITSRVHCFLHKHSNDSWDIHFSEESFLPSNKIEDAFGWMYADGKVGIKYEDIGKYKIEKCGDFGEKIFLRILKKK